MGMGTIDLEYFYHSEMNIRMFSPIQEGQMSLMLTHWLANKVQQNLE